MTPFLRCLGGPLDRADLLPGDDVPDGGRVRLRGHDNGSYRRIGGHLLWVARRPAKPATEAAVGFYRAMTREERT